MNEDMGTKKGKEMTEEREGGRERNEEGRERERKETSRHEKQNMKKG